MIKKRSRYAALVATLLFVAGAALIKQDAAYPKGAFDYVALGSSFAAGPGIAQRAPHSYLPCWRSNSDYAHLFANAAGLRLNDVTCSGATTANLLQGGQWFQPAQVSAIGPETKLVTITVGGNDVFYLGNLVASSCQHLPHAVPMFLRAIGSCLTTPPQQVERAFQELPMQLTHVVNEVQRRAPRARVVLVDYVTILPSTGTCARLPLSDDEVSAYRQMAKRLAVITADVAATTQTELLRASAITEDHNLCSTEPWVNGLEFPKDLHSFGPAPFHPKYEAMNAIAKLLLDTWRDSPHL